MTNAEQVIGVVKQISDDFGHPLIVVNNAGITKDNIILRMKAEEWDSVIDTNLSAAFRVVKACLRGMTKLAGVGSLI